MPHSGAVMATYAVGDIHGRADLLETLLSRLDATTGDHVVFLGDYIDRGPDSRGVIDRLLEFEAASNASTSFLLGNHEHSMLRTLSDRARFTWILSMGGLATIRSYSVRAAATLEQALRQAGLSLLDGGELPFDCFVEAIPDTHLQFFQRLQPFVRTDDVLCLHAGLSNDGVRIEDQVMETLVWGELDWWNSYSGTERIVYGHWRNACLDDGLAIPHKFGRTYGIDCAASGQLIALRFPDLRVMRAP